MVAASFLTLAFWMAVLGLFFTLLCLCADFADKRDQERRKKERRQRREYMDNLQAKKWDGRPW